MGNLQVFLKNIHNITFVFLLIYKLPKRYIKKYKIKYLSWLQGETRKLHKISEDKNLTESVHRKFRIPCEISHGVRNSLATSRSFAWCAKFSTTMRKCWLLDFFLWFSSLHFWFAWQSIAKLGKGLWSAPQLGLFMYLSFNLHCHGFELPKTDYQPLLGSLICQLT